MQRMPCPTIYLAASDSWCVVPGTLMPYYLMAFGPSLSCQLGVQTFTCFRLLHALIPCPSLPSSVWGWGWGKKH